MNKRIAYGLTAAALLAGCASLAPFTGEGTATLEIQPTFNSGRLVQTMPEVRPYDESSVDRVIVELYRDGENTPLKQATVTNHRIPVQFVKLHPNTTYRILAKAYTDDDHKISDDASSSVTLAIAYNDRPTLAKLPVGLLNRGFNGQATASIAIATGSLTTTDPASMSVEVLDN
ncbi:hypothetical protein J7643_17170 [bacterium]|nr:hypothetical protein [bacterium]